MSRHRFALFRLLSPAKVQPANVMLFHDRDQESIDHYAASIWIVLTLTCYVAATLFARLPLAVALLVSLPLALFALQILVAVIGLLTARAARRHRVNSVTLMALLIALAAYFTRAASWARFVAWFFLAVVALNALAFLIEKIGGRPSAA